MENSYKRNLTIRIIQRIILLIIILTFLIYFANNIEHFRKIIFEIKAKWIPLIIFINLASNFVKSIGWAYITKNMGCSLSYNCLIAIWHFSLIGNYIPGSIWASLGRVYALHRLNFSKKKAIYSVGLEQIFTLAAAIFISFTSAEILSYIHLPLSLGIITSMLMLVVLFPHIFGKIIWNLGFHRIDFRHIPNIPLRKTFIYFMAIIIAYYINGIAIVMLMKLFDLNVFTINISNATAMQATSFVIGYLSFLTPNGIGVKEGVFAFLINNHVTLNTALIIAATLRVWLIMSNFFSISLSYIYIKFKKIDI